jgi:hypothetical protein
MSDLNKVLQARKARPDTVYVPTIFRIQHQKDALALFKILNDDTSIRVIDEIESQLQELIKLRSPQHKYSSSELSKEVSAFLGDIPIQTCGVWVYYPWSKNLVHLLDENEYIEVRTNRNQYKITQAERDVLGTKKVGVVGLSVGKTIALAMAMERSFGEIRLADFDSLELTNLNRLQTGVFNLGLSKAIVVAREIAEIDPFLKTVCFTEGLHQDNLDEFFEAGGNLDLLLEECDGLDIKILVRQKARAMKIPVVMDMNDRGTLDVERFDLEPDRPLLHGLIDHLDISKIKSLSNEEKVPYILPMLGSETISSKLKASMIEIGQTISTWPQLASSVTLGGALASDVSRRILLDQFHESGRYWVDLEELICDKNSSSQPYVERNQQMPLTELDMLNCLEKISTVELEGQKALSPETIKELVAAAILAPTAGNNQPWKWIYKGKTLYLFFDASCAPYDFENNFTLIGLGAAAENLILKAHELGLEVSKENKEISTPNSPLAAVFQFFSRKDFFPASVESHTCDELVQNIPLRGTNRRIGLRQKISTVALSKITKAVETIPGAEFKILQSTDDLIEIGEIVACVDRLRLMDERAHHHFVKEIMWSHADALLSKVGVDIDTIDLSPSELAGFRMSRYPEVIKHLNDWKGGKAFEKLGRKTIASASAVGLITMPAYSGQNYFEGGRALQRAWLAATSLSVSVHPVSACTLFFAWLERGNGKGFSAETISELIQLKKRFMQLFALHEKGGQIFMIKLGVAEEMKTKSLRRDLGDVLHILEL